MDWSIDDPGGDGDGDVDADGDVDGDGDVDTDVDGDADSDPPGCGADAFCNLACSDDPDCCGADAFCNPSCSNDPDCTPDCNANGVCNRACAEGADPDCEDDGCPPPVPLDGECDPVDQTCCGGGEECIITSSPPNREVCVSAIRGGSGVDGDLCPDGDRDCALGYACTDHYDVIRTCSRFCATEVDCPLDLPPYDCNFFIDVPEYGLCYPRHHACSPVSNGGCPADLSCNLIIRSTTLAFPVCFPIGLNSPGDSCSDLNGCVRGYGCHDRGSGLRCYQYCVLADPTCATGTCQEVGHTIEGICE
jgi:hypothetical protein